MSLEERKAALLELKDALDRILEGKGDSSEEQALAKEVNSAFLRDPWFTPDHMRVSLASLSEMLHEEAIDSWIAPYANRIEDSQGDRKVLLILAGNIPFVGVQDLLAVLLFGHKALIKAPSKDDRSLSRLLELISTFGPFGDRIEQLERPIATPDAIIATGSDNTSRYFEYYFGHLPHTFRGHRSGAAVLEGDEDEEELKGLMKDLFLYFGRGCRNVSKLYVPEDWDPSAFLEVVRSEEWLKEHQKYMNNYAYHKAIYLMNGERFYDGECLLLKEDEALTSPLGTLFYETYRDREQLQELLNRDAEKLQCIVGRGRTPFGRAQFPALGEHEAEKDPLALLAEI